MFSKEVLRIVRRLQEARLSLMRKQPFYAVLLLHMQFSLDPMCETAYTDGERIAFCPDFIESLSDSELEFVLMHEVLHAALNHCNRTQDSYDYDDFNTACDIVVNSNILHSFNMDVSKITLDNYGESMHIAPDGKEGYEYTAEEVYMLIQAKNAVEITKEKKDSSKGDEEKLKKKKSDEAEDEKDKDGQSDGSDDDESESGDEHGEYNTPARSDGGFDDHTYWGFDDNDNPSCQGGDGEGEGSGGDDSEGEGDGEGSEDDDSEGDGDSDGKAVYGSESGSKGQAHETNPGHKKSNNKSVSKDKYSKDDIKDVWLHRMIEATEIAEQISVRQGSNGCGNIPFGAQRIVKELTEPQTDWRTVLDMFIQEEITDYSFNPPDRRFQDSPFLLPDYNEKDESVKDILFMIDTSGSMSDHMITQAYSEIYGAIQQFNGNLQGWLGFFDAYVVEPKEFTDEEEFKIIRPVGGGGTSFQCIFEYVKEHIDEINPASIIILTDGYAPWPEEEAAMDIPVLWLINNENANPPWGKVARIKVEQGVFDE